MLTFCFFFWYKFIIIFQGKPVKVRILPSIFCPIGPIVKWLGQLIDSTMKSLDLQLKNLKTSGPNGPIGIWLGQLIIYIENQ